MIKTDDGWHADNLPPHCYGRLLTDGQIMLIKRGESGYYPLAGGPMYGTEEDLLELNARIGVTPAQAAAMSIGSMFSWDAPGADPANYNEDGSPKKEV